MFSTDPRKINIDDVIAGLEVYTSPAMEWYGEEPKGLIELCRDALFLLRKNKGKEIGMSLSVYSDDEKMDELLDKMIDYLKDHEINDLVRLVSDAISRKEQL